MWIEMRVINVHITRMRNSELNLEQEKDQLKS